MAVVFHRKRVSMNPLNAELNPIGHLLALLGAHHILHVSRVAVKRNIVPPHSEDSHTGKMLWGNRNKSTTLISITKMISANQRVMIQKGLHQCYKTVTVHNLAYKIT